MEDWRILGDIVTLLAACLLLGGIASRLKLSPLVGYLLAGMLLGGPGSVRLVESEPQIEGIAELGVALLLFSLGLEFSLERLKQLGAKPLLGGGLQVVVTMLVGWLCAWPFAASGREALAFGVMISLSSTAIVLRMLMERAELDMPHGRNSLAVLLTQDIAVVPLAIIMTLLAGGGGAAGVLLQVGKLSATVLGLVVGLAIINFLAVKALGTLTLLRNRELTMIFAVVTGLGATWAAHAAGISPALGAFVAGMLLGASQFATQIRADISSLRVVLLTLFFGSAGMVADPIWILKNWYIVAGVTALLIVGKTAIVLVIFRQLGHTARVAAATGLCLSQIGEFAFVLGAIGKTNKVVSDEMYSLVVSVTIVSFFLSAWLVPAAPKFGNWVARRLREGPGDSSALDDEAESPDVVIIGFGPAGQVAALPIVDLGEKVMVLDLNREGIRQAQRLGFRGEIGDATQNDVLEHIHLAQVKAVVITVPHHQSALTILAHVRQNAPHAHVIVRSRYQLHADELSRAGAHAVIGDEQEVGEGMSKHLKEWLADNERRRAREMHTEIMPVSEAERRMLRRDG